MLLGVGNRLSHDDGVGPVVAQALADSDWIATDCGTALENTSGIVSRERPDLLVIVDAAFMGMEPGTFCRLPIGANDRMLASTHGLPLSFVLANIESAAKETVLIGIEPDGFVVRRRTVSGRRRVGTCAHRAPSLHQSGRDSEARILLLKDPIVRTRFSLEWGSKTDPWGLRA